MRTIFRFAKSDCCDPFVYKARILPNAHMPSWIDAIREQIVASRTASSFKPSGQCGSNIRGQFKLHRVICFLLDDCGPIANIGTRDHIADFNLHEVAAAQFAIDGEVKKSSVPQSPSRSR